MPESWRKLLLGLALLLGLGTIIGAFYGRAEIGLLIAALLALIWQVRQLLAFDRAIRTGDFSDFRYGEGLWEQLYSRFQYQSERATRHKQRHRDLLREIRKSTNAMPDGAVILDRNLEIVTCNRAAKRLAGLKPRKDRGQRVDNIVRQPALTRLLEGDNFKASIDIESPLRDGEWLNCRVVPYGADQRLLLMRDITDRIQLNKMRKDFVANASHELRSPLTVINGYLDSLLEDESIPPDWEQPMQQMQVQAQRMTRVVSELLELSSLESGGPARTDGLVDVAGLLAGAVSSTGKGESVPEITLDIRSGALLRGNSAQIESVINNLLSNAVRHTPPDGSIVLGWDSDEKGAVIRVSDTGEGISAQHLPRLTERFFRVDRGRSRDDGGIGLGLAIVKHALGRHDAELRVSSTPGEGSEFSARFGPDRVVPEETAEVGTG